MSFRIAPSVLRFADKVGITPKKLEDMVSAAALVSHPEGNRRFHNWLFKVENGTVRFMTPIAPSTDSSSIGLTPLGPNEFLVYEECEECDGDGCEGCNFEGTIPVVRRHRSNR